MQNKKIFYNGNSLILLCLVCILNIVGCSNEKEVAKLEKITVSSNLATEICMGNCSINNKKIAKVLENKKKYFDIELQKYMYLRDYASVNYMVHNDDGKYEYVNDGMDWSEKLKIKRWSETDMDSDGNKEVLLELNSSNILVLHDENNVIYGYAFPYRGMNSIKKDGSFQESSSAADTYIGKLKFIDGECFYDEICVIDELHEKKPIYRLNKKDSNRKVVKSYLKEQEKKENILWVDGNPSNR